MNRRYSSEERAEAIRLTEESGASRASRELGIPHSTLVAWSNLRSDDQPGVRRTRGRKTYSQRNVDQALQRVNEVGLNQASAELGITIATLARWLEERTLSKKRSYSAKEKAHALSRVLAVGIQAAARETTITVSTLRPWALAAGIVKSTPKKTPDKKYAPEFKTQVVAHAEATNVRNAAITFGIAEQNIRYWIRTKSKGHRLRHYSEALKREAVALAELTNTSHAARQLGVPATAVKSWRAKMGRSGESLSAPPVRNASPALKAEAIKLASRMGDEVAAEELNVRPSTIKRWRRQQLPAQRRKLRYDDEEREAAVTLALAKGLIRAAVELHMSESTLANWIRLATPKEAKSSRSPARKAPHSYTAETKKRAVEMLGSASVSSVSERLQVSPQSVIRWAKAAGVALVSRAGLQTGFDVDLRWIAREYPELDAWTPLAQQWISGEKHSIGQRLTAVRTLLVKYILRFSLPIEPTTFLLRSHVLPDFFEACCTNSTHGVSIANFASEFIDWILLHKMSEPDDHGRPAIIPVFRNPIAKRSHVGIEVPTETVYSPLPYSLIEELRQTLAEGPNFSDWHWAIASGEGRGISGAVMDWFEIREDQLDLSDPDCVFRRRLRGEASGGEVLEMWSPVRWVALLIKLILPLRTFQTRMLDSGEADTFSCIRSLVSGDFEWVVNGSPLREGTAKKPLRQGVLRKPAQNFSLELKDAGTSAPQVVAYINTNKTADISSGDAEKGYVMPWLAVGSLIEDPYYWFEKIARWQKKYNPITRRTKWSQLDARHRDAKSASVLKTYPDACFLFRTPEGKPHERHLPLTDGGINVAWHRLLTHFEETLALRGRRLADGSRIRLIPEISADSSHRTLFPLHSLRVSLITALALEGKLPFPILQKLVGHSRVLMTIYYTKPSEAYIARSLSEAAVRLEGAKESALLDFLKSKDHKLLMKEVICNSPATIATVLPEHVASRSAAGWKQMHHGLCMVGGNVNAFEGVNSVGGCFNGGENIGSATKPKWLPVPGGAHNCVRCRWFVTSPAHLWALVSHFNVLMYHFDEARNACLESEKALDALKIERMRSEDACLPFTKQSQLATAQRTWEALMQRFDDLAQDAAACCRLAMRCREALNQLRADSTARALISSGSEVDVRLAIESTDSELLQLAGVCETSEIYPEIDVGKAIFRRSQLLDAALYREGYKPIFLTMTEDEQRKNGNEFLRSLSSIFDANDTDKGRVHAISLIDAEASIDRELGIAMSRFAPLTAELRSHRLQRPRVLRS